MDVEEIWVGVVNDANANSTILINYDDAPGSTTFDACEFSGLLTADYIDQIATAYVLTGQDFVPLKQWVTCF